MQQSAASNGTLAMREYSNEAGVGCARALAGGGSLRLRDVTLYSFSAPESTSTRNVSLRFVRAAR